MRIFTVILVVLLTLAIFTIEPISLNPFAAQPTIEPFSNSTVVDGKDTSIQTTQKLEKKINELLYEGWSNNKYMGLSVGVLRHGKYQSEFGMGVADKTDLSPITNDTIFRIASLTKPMTAIAIMQLVEKGKLSLDDTLAELLPELELSTAEQITVESLLNHTSGVPHYRSKLEAMSFTHFNSMAEAAIEIVNKAEIQFTPNQRFEYSSYGYALLGAIIEAVSGNTYGQYMLTNIFEPAGMTNTSIEKDIDGKSSLYLKVANYFIKSPKNDLSIIRSAGGIQSTISDLMKFSNALFDNQFISEDSLKKMIAVTQLSKVENHDPYGLGWVVYERKKGKPIIAHSGSQPGASAYLEIRLEEKTSIAVLSNAFGTKGYNYELTQSIALEVRDLKY